LKKSTGDNDSNDRSCCTVPVDGLLCLQPALQVSHPNHEGLIYGQVAVEWRELGYDYPDMLKLSLTSLLILMLASPLNAGAVSWMAASMDDSEHAGTLHQVHAAHVAYATHSAHTDNSAIMELSDQAATGGQLHEHDSADCEEHCASCSNHCSSLAIVSSQQHGIVGDRHPAGFQSGLLLHHHDTLFRPPIHS